MSVRIPFGLPYLVVAVGLVSYNIGLIFASIKIGNFVHPESGDELLHCGSNLVVDLFLDVQFGFKHIK